MQEVKMLRDKVQELERVIEILDQEGVDKCEKLEKQSKQIKALEKALDNACEKLEGRDKDVKSEFDRNANNVGLVFPYKMRTKEEWKEWLLKED